MKTCLTAVLTLVAATACAAQQNAGAGTNRESGTSPKSPFDGAARTELASSTVTVPLTKTSGFYYADVLVNGQRFRFTLETGAGFFAISNRAARALGLQPDSVELMPGSRSAVVRIDSLSLGGVTLHDLVARVTGTLDERDFDGLISIPFFTGMLATIDLGASRLVFTRGSLPVPNGIDVLPIPRTDRGGRVDVEVSLGGVPGFAVLDSRSFVWLIAPDSLSQRLRLESAPRSVGMAWGPTMGSFELRAARLADPLRIGSTSIERSPIAFRNRPGIVAGVPFLEQFAITLDLRNSRIRFSRPAGAGAIVIPVQSWDTSSVEPRRATASGNTPASGQRTMGFGIAGPPGGGRLNIVNVTPQSSAAKAGIREGDQLLELDGTPAAAMSPAIVRAAVAKGTKINVIVLRDGRQLEFNIDPYVVP